MREQLTRKECSGKRDKQYNKAFEAGASVACWRDGTIKEEHVGDKIRKRELDHVSLIRTLDFILSKV